MNFLRYGQLEEAYELIRKSPDDFSDEVLFRTVRALSESGFYIQSLRLGTVLRRRKVPDMQELKYLYPLAFNAEMKKAIEGTEIDWRLFYGLVREESYFDAGISSRVGASGLAQLMPATAREVAAKAGIHSPDLLDPETNLLLGAKYFDGLLKRFNNVEYAVIAYNAGPSRIRRWERTYKDFPDDFFIEMIPIGESREYLKKILESTVYYDFLYGKKNFREIVEMFFVRL
jgi:soluble lytic murein transglycosylase